MFHFVSVDQRERTLDGALLLIALDVAQNTLSVYFSASGKNAFVVAIRRVAMISGSSYTAVLVVW